MDNLDKGKEAILKASVEPDLPEIHGYDFNKGVDFGKIIDSYANMGFQAAHLAKAIAIIKKMREEKCTIYLGYTSNMVTSGLRDIFRYLAEHKLVDIIVTTAGGIEEDFIKCLGPFLLGRFDADGAKLREDGVNRTGNIFVPNSRYCKFEDWITPLFDELTTKQVETGHIHTPSEIIDFLGSKIDDKSSIYHWAHKNNIPVFCPALTDGSFGDMLFFFKYKRPELMIDIANDLKKLNDITLNAKKTGIIILGSGVIKHHILNTNLMRNGADYSVYLNNSQEFDGSDAGARPDEAVSWGKLIAGSESVKVFGDATILFPLIVAKAFVD
ncbi:deoxyhypusine synthase [Candidatus Woesearchaeota archaeon]|nr:deoxyhypusine synthase [Candidatus Woesearchaeota archaeon]